VVTSLGLRNSYKDMLDNEVSPITCVSMNHQNQLEQMAKWRHVRYMFAIPQTTTPQAAVTSSFLDQLQMTTPTSSQLPYPLTTRALVFETPARTTLPSPQVSSPLPSFTTPRAEGLGKEDYYLRAITEQISSTLASDPEVPAPEATQAPTSGTRTTTAPPAPPPPAPGPSSPTWSLLSEDDDNDNDSGFSVRPSRTVSTSQPDPSSPSQP
jgi:hypothetical protein